MDRTTRWETEAIRKRPPQPSRAQKSDFRAPHAGAGQEGNWATLREAEAATGIPINTLRKWIRRADLPSYLEADGDLALRMVDLDAVIARAEELGRDIVPASESETDAVESAAPPSETAHAADLPQETAPPDTMIVPVDAWNKMLNQLGNLHEAGQQLAEARERAAKAETEAKFLRVQLADSRSDEILAEPGGTEGILAASTPPDEKERPVEVTESTPDSTTYWRYLTSGWRDRKRRRG